VEAVDLVVEALEHSQVAQQLEERETHRQYLHLKEITVEVLQIRQVEEAVVVLLALVAMEP
jgi:hypothetical protein